MDRTYKTVISADFVENRQMIMLSGPRQVGKATLSRSLGVGEGVVYLNWDDSSDRELILSGTEVIAEKVGLGHLHEKLPIVVFDEIHKYSGWKQLLKGFFDRYQGECRVIVTGSARMDIFKKGGDSLMGRYFNYRLHPFSVGEILRESSLAAGGDVETCLPEKIAEEDFEALLKWGGFPEPYLKRNSRFYNRWSRLRDQQLLSEDVRELTRVQELGQLELLAKFLKHQSGQQTSYTALAKKIRVSVDTVRRWLGILEALFYCFSIRPWSKNVMRSLLKEPKIYLWDWSQCSDEGARNENFIASHLLKAVDFWTDTGLGDYGLHYLRDKEQREVDFLISKNGEPWAMVEVKSSATAKLSKSLRYFADQLNVEHVLQVAIDAPFVNKDVFSLKRPMVVPARTLLSQLP